MNFGVSDLLLCIQLAYSVWEGCREAPRDFRAVCAEVASLHLVLKEARETAHNLSGSKGEDLKQLINGCKSVLQELEERLQRYKSLGTQSRRTWDRLRWGKGPVKDLQRRLRSCTASLTLFNTGLTNAGLARVETLLQQLVLDHQSGLREGSVISTDNLDSAEDGDEDIWRQIARELDDIGITSDLIREHRVYITNWIRMALETGELQEASPPMDSIRGNESDVEADVTCNSPSFSLSSPLLNMREIKHIREESQSLGRSPYSGQSQGYLSPMPMESSASETWSPSSQEGILPFYDVTLDIMPQIGSYSCNMCKHGGIFTTWFEVLSHARTHHDGSSGSGTESLTLATLLQYPNSRDNDAVNELIFTMTTLFQALEELEDRLMPSNFPLLIHDLYYSETCPFSECLAQSRSPELNREHIREHFSFNCHNNEETPFLNIKACLTSPVFKLYVCETRGCWSSQESSSNFGALEEHFREKHSGLDCQRLSPGVAAHGYYISFSGRRLRDIWAIAESKKSETEDNGARANL